MIKGCKTVETVYSLFYFALTILLAYVCYYNLKLLNMKSIICTIILLISVTGFSQEVFFHDVDEYLSMNVPEDAVEGEMSGLTYIQGTLDDILINISKTDKGNKKLAKQTDLTRFYEGVKSGSLKASKGKLISEAIIEIDNQEIYNFSFSATIEGEDKIINTYIFFWKEYTYTIQFMSPENESDHYKESVSSIIDSIELN